MRARAARGRGPRCRSKPPRSALRRGLGVVPELRSEPCSNCRSDVFRHWLGRIPGRGFGVRIQKEMPPVLRRHLRKRRAIAVARLLIALRPPHRLRTALLARSLLVPRASVVLLDVVRRGTTEPGRACPLGLSVGLVLADSSVVTIAPAERSCAQFDVEVATLAWALTSFNLRSRGLCPAGGFCAARRPALVFGVGIVVFAAASLACASPFLVRWLVAGRTVQGVAGAAVVSPRSICSQA